VARDYRVVGIALRSGSPADVKKYLKEHNLQVPVVNDPDGALAGAWGVRGTPTSFIVDGAGMIRFREIGYTSEPGLRLRLWLARL
jgi:peroxiredoxin